MTTIATQVPVRGVPGPGPRVVPAGLIAAELHAGTLPGESVEWLQANVSANQRAGREPAPVRSPKPVPIAQIGDRLAYALGCRSVSPTERSCPQFRVDRHKPLSISGFGSMSLGAHRLTPQWHAVCNLRTSTGLHPKLLTSQDRDSSPISLPES
jgi:hypothetical protein